MWGRQPALLEEQWNADSAQSYWAGTAKAARKGWRCTAGCREAPGLSLWAPFWEGSGLLSQALYGTGELRTDLWGISHLYCIAKLYHWDTIQGISWRCLKKNDTKKNYCLPQKCFFFPSSLFYFSMMYSTGASNNKPTWILCPKASDYFASMPGIAPRCKYF